MSGPIRARKRPVIVEAYRFTGTNTDAVAAWVGRDAYVDDGGGLIIRTLEGDHLASPGDWVMCGTLGEYYPIKPAVFDSVYDQVSG